MIEALQSIEMTLFSRLQNINLIERTAHCSYL